MKSISEIIETSGGGFYFIARWDEPGARDELEKARERFAGGGMPRIESRSDGGFAVSGSKEKIELLHSDLLEKFGWEQKQET